MQITSSSQLRLGALLLFVLLLSACTGAGPASPTPTAAAVDDPPAPAAAAPPPETATRTVSHELGTTEVPADPERIVVTGRRGTLPILLDLGFAPVGALDASFILGQPFHPLAADAAEAAGTQPIDRTDLGPDLEQVAALDPDLIIGAAIDFADVADELAAIAPTVGIAWDFTDPLANVLAVGEAMGVPDEAAALVADFQDRVDAAAATVEDPGTVSIIGLFAPDDLRIYRAGNLVGELVQAMGGTLLPTEEELPLEDDGVINTVSLERLDLAAGERLISFVNLGQENQAAYAELAADPLVQALPGFRSGRVVEVDPQLVFGTAGVTGLQVLVDQVATALAS